MNNSFERLERFLDTYNNAGGWKTSCLTKALALALLPKSCSTPKLLAKILCCSNFLPANKHFDVLLGWKNLFAEQGITLFSRGILHNYLSCSAATKCFKLLKKNICHICIVIFQGI